MTGRLIRSRLAAYADGIAEHWIGWTLPPAQRPLDEADWRPDGREGYCGRCGDSVGPGEATDEGCATCRDGAELHGGIADGVVRLGTHTNLLRQWILTIKYHRWAEMGLLLGRVLGRQLIEAGVVEIDRAVVVPMPMPWQRRMYRGIDHARVIAGGVAAELDLPLASILRKGLQTPQVSLTSTQRKRSGKRGLAVRRRWGGWRIDGLDIVLVDDVRTTGASLKAAARLLKSLQPRRVVCGVLAVSDSTARRDRDQQGRTVSSA